MESVSTFRGLHLARIQVLAVAYKIKPCFRFGGFWKSWVLRSRFNFGQLLQASASEAKSMSKPAKTLGEQTMPGVVQRPAVCPTYSLPTDSIELTMTSLPGAVAT